TGGVLALVSQAARAVGYAHGRGLAHLGLAPTNIMVTVEGDVKITDFGILAATMPARPVEAARLANRIPYLAPEQLAGDATSAARSHRGAQRRQHVRRAGASCRHRAGSALGAAARPRLARIGRSRHGGVRAARRAGRRADAARRAAARRRAELDDARPAETDD